MTGDFVSCCNPRSTFRKGFMKMAAATAAVTADEIRKARKEWDSLIWKKAILQALKRQGFDPDFVKKLEASYKSSRESFIQKFGKYVEWV